jgi:RND family efflux transporter MFP subunit
MLFVAHPRAVAVIVCFALFALAAATVAGPAQAQGRASAVQVDTVSRQPLAATIEVLGRFVPRQSGTIAARVSERVGDVMVQVGDRVAQGAVLARLSDDRLVAEKERREAQANAASANVARERANLAKAQQTLDRQNRLKGSNAYRADRVEDAERDVDAARAALVNAQADAQEAKAQLDLAEIALADAVITAPYDGVVTVKHVSAGSYVRNGDPVVTMLNVSELEVEADVPATRTGGLQPGTLVAVETQTGDRLFSVVRAVVPEEDPRTRTRAVRLVPQGEDAYAASANESVTVLVPIDQMREVLTVHKDAVTVQGPRRVVFVVEEGKASPRVVELGESVGERFEVRSGLKEGDQTVVRGNERLRPGQPVAVGG